jgi:hypothetical protein
MEALAASLPPEALNRVGFRLYERFRPDVPEGAQGNMSLAKPSDDRKSYLDTMPPKFYEARTPRH